MTNSKLDRLPSPQSLSEIEVEIIDLFVNLLHFAGLPKSAGEIYGVLFASTRPMIFEEIAVKLDISSGSVSQGLRLLRSLNAVRTAYVAGDRRDHYVAETDLQKLTAGFLRGNLEQRLVSGEERLTRLNRLLSHCESTPGSSHEFFEARVETLRVWNQRARAILPLVMQVLH